MFFSVAHPVVSACVKPNDVANTQPPPLLVQIVTEILITLFIGTAITGIGFIIYSLGKKNVKYKQQGLLLLVLSATLFIVYLIFSISTTTVCGT